MSKPRAVGGNRTASRKGDTLPWVNAAGETIPAFAVVQFRTDVVDGMNQASKPDGGEGLFFVSGPADVASGKWGESRLWDRPRMVLVSETVQVGDEVGPVADSWEMQPGGTGYRVIHQDITGIATVTPVGGGGSGAQIIGFQIISSDPTVRSARVEILQRSFQGTVYGSELDDTVVNVYDTKGCDLNEANVDLTGRRGDAVLVWTDQDAADLHFGGYLSPTKYWRTITVCCPNVVCE